MPNDLMFKSAAQQAELVRSGELSARELVEASLASIERLNGELNAVVTLCAERALAEADAVGPGDDRPLAGVPILVKDLVAFTEGVRTTMGHGRPRRLGARRSTPPWCAGCAARARSSSARPTSPSSASCRSPSRRASARRATRGTPARTRRRLVSGGSRRRGGGRHGADRARQRRRRLDPHPRLVLRARRAEAQPRPQSRSARMLGELVSGFVTEGVRRAHRARHRGVLDCIAGSEPGDPYWAPARAARSPRRRATAAGRAADRVRHRLAQRRPKSTRNACAAREGPPGCSSRSATTCRRWRSRRTRATIDALREGLDAAASRAS